MVNNETEKLEALSTILRDFFIGQRLDNWTKPYYDGSKDTLHCMIAYTDEPWQKYWHTIRIQSEAECDIRENFDTNECPNIFVSTKLHE